MRTSAGLLGFRSLSRLAVVEMQIAVAIVMTMLVAGCGPTTPHVGSSSPAATSVDGGAEVPRVPAPSVGDAGVERGGPVPFSGAAGTSSCAPISSVDAGAMSPIVDAGGDGGREAGTDALAPDARNSDDAAIGNGGRAGAVGGNPGTAGSAGSGAGGSVGAAGMSAPGAVGGVGGSAGSGAVIGRGGGGGTGTAGMGGAGNAVGGAGAGGSNSLAPVPGIGDLAIVELLINPTSTDTGREWIEIVNRTTHALTLAGLYVSDAANNAAVDFGTTVSTSLLAAGARMVLIQSADATKNGGVMLGAATPGGSFGTLVSLNNDADTISICVGPCATGVVIDRVAWDASLGTGYDGHALVIDDSARRCPATLAFGDAGSFGTPGSANAACP